MGNFSLFDFISFILPGGTFIVFLYLLLSWQGIQLAPGKYPDAGLLVIPYLFISYLTGHLLSFLGKRIEKLLPGMKHPWVTYLQNHPADAARINDLCIGLFGNGVYKADSRDIDSDKTDTLYDRIYDFLEIRELDKKIKILVSQYAFFRNSTAVWVTLLIALLLIMILKISGIIPAGYNYLAWTGFTVVMILLALASAWLMKTRKKLAMSVVYRTFLAHHIKH